MTLMMIAVMCLLLLAGYPMMMPLLAATVLAFWLYLPDLAMQQIVQQMIGGVKPSALVAVPMFILAADIITRGQSADRLVDLVMRFMGHLRGGLAISVTSACALFGAVCGSTQATVVAVGGAMRPRMLRAGYRDDFTIGLIVNAADLAYLIPPSIGMIVYGVLSGTSISELFIAGIGPGLLVVVLFSVWCWYVARKEGLPVERRATWAERFHAARRALWPLGFPALVVGGIYGGIFSPTEAAAICVLYATLLELLIFRSIGLKDLWNIALSTGMMTSVVFILIATGAAFSWTISYAQVPQQILAAIGLEGAGPMKVLLVINLAFFIGCMFVDSLVVMLILVPIFAPLVAATGLDPVLVGILVTLQVAIGAATPPFGCNLFTAVAVFRRPFVDVVRGVPPFLLILLLVAVLLSLFPWISLGLRDLAFR
ncbi:MULTISPECIES: TRAP transporter large permease [unclassified Shinella]|jgi:C4-dicarboxylate transporter, DctM subunit|uniref:TRAP transporter large permease n=1 Tax=unclassified Shinella TaxID=2643062 RepID=UPI000437BD17|nr:MULTISPECIES: TRAP transporter large permease [unclassified Shinella]MCA0343971.1 TRAP transporter large permease [Pseudomonadota bacterium]EYR84652.1 putative TRAP transporter large permease protein [Shinella sp. DD12]KNY14090.1 C4-dicarboxylate ABC transporter permease [Shinella sp. SUS2]KOC73637.1 C4-dicarboxylate ABC transporter permease [Shinella sp. GWS1]MCO5149064.1 TRAP transporter large permease [Shinella sp.]